MRFAYAARQGTQNFIWLRSFSEKRQVILRSLAPSREGRGKLPARALAVGACHLRQAHPPNSPLKFGQSALVAKMES